jgi:hypothetical protein
MIKALLRWVGVLGGLCLTGLLASIAGPRCVGPQADIEAAGRPIGHATGTQLPNVVDGDNVWAGPSRWERKEP